MSRTKWAILALTTVAIVSIALTAYIVGPSMIERRPFDAPDPSYSSWEEILANPQPITLRTYSTAMMETHLSGIMNLEHESAQGIEDEAIEFPVVVGILEHEEHGAYLVDAGMDASCVDNPYGVMRGAIVEQKLGRATQEPGTDIASVVEREGVALQGVLLTHLHPDHVAGIVDLPKDIPYVVGEGEAYINYPFIIHGDHLEGIDALNEIDFASGIDLPPFGKCIDVFGDGSVWAIPAPGHTAGSTVFLVNGLDGQYLMTGDACMTRDLFDAGIGPGTYSSDVEQAQVALEQIKEFAERYPEVELVFGHDL
jgi:glyoxylase-like metal-dependent hydrolase (beta-lactamase superfamily II)